MKTYTVHHRSDTPAGILEDPDGAVFVKEGFAWAAFFVPFFWALWNRMWIVAALIFAAAVLISGLAQWFRLDGGISFAVSMLVNLLIALEGNELLRWSLERRGLGLAGIVTGHSRNDCEFIYFDRLIREAETPPERPSGTVPAFRLQPSHADEGLFPMHGGAT
ncbi:MAG: DUF2628 domain-containing protein [Pseudomonadota bacterium]